MLQSPPVPDAGRGTHGMIPGESGGGPTSKGEKRIAVNEGTIGGKSQPSRQLNHSTKERRISSLPQQPIQGAAREAAIRNRNMSKGQVYTRTRGEGIEVALRGKKLEQT